MTPRKWTAADVTPDDLRSVAGDAAKGHGTWLYPIEVAACWNRLEEKRAKEESDPFFDADHLAEVGAYMEDRAREKLLAQALEALQTVARYPIARGYPDGPCIDREDMKEIQEAIAALEKEVSQ